MTRRPPPLFGADRLAGGKPRARVQPAGDLRPVRQLLGLAGGINQDTLAHVLGEQGVPADLPQGGGIDQASLARHQLGEGRFRPLMDVAAQQFGIVGHHLLTPVGAVNGTSARKIFSGWTAGRVGTDIRDAHHLSSFMAQKHLEFGPTFPLPAICDAMISCRRGALRVRHSLACDPKPWRRIGAGGTPRLLATDLTRGGGTPPAFKAASRQPGVLPKSMLSSTLPPPCNRTR